LFKNVSWKPEIRDNFEECDVDGITVNGSERNRVQECELGSTDSGQKPMVISANTLINFRIP
jgi:hypothetical protein